LSQKWKRNNLSYTGALHESLSFGTEVGVTNVCGCDKQLAFGKGFLKVMLITLLH